MWTESGVKEMPAYNTQFATSVEDSKSICNFFGRHFFSFANANKHFTFKQAFVRHGSKHA
jgi:hypothetical protein